MVLAETSGSWLIWKNVGEAAPGPGGGGWRRNTGLECSPPNTCAAHFLTQLNTSPCQGSLPWSVCPHSHLLPPHSRPPYPVLTFPIALPPPATGNVSHLCYLKPSTLVLFCWATLDPPPESLLLWMDGTHENLEISLFPSSTFLWGPPLPRCPVTLLSLLPPPELFSQSL